MSFMNSASLRTAALHGKDNIYLELICKLHIQFKVWNLNGYSVLPGGNTDSVSISKGVGFAGFFPLAPSPPAPNCQLDFRSTRGLSAWKANP